MPCREDIMKRPVWKLHLELQPRLSSNLVVLTLIVLILPILNLNVFVLTVVPNYFETNSAPDGILTNIESIEEGMTSKQPVGILEVKPGKRPTTRILEPNLSVTERGDVGVDADAMRTGHRVCPGE